MKRYFEGMTVAETRTEYRTLAALFMPRQTREFSDPDEWDRKNATMQEINAQYHAHLHGKHGETSKDSAGKKHTYYYNREHEDALAEKLAELLRAELPGCEIRIIGKWLWVSGETRPLAAKLGREGLGLTWHSKRRAWYWKPYKKSYTRYNDKMSLDDLQGFYGGRNFQGKERAETEASLVTA